MEPKASKICEEIEDKKKDVRNRWNNNKYKINKKKNHKKYRKIEISKPRMKNQRNATKIIEENEHKKWQE